MSSIYNSFNQKLAELQTVDNNIFTQEVVGRLGHLAAIPLGLACGVVDGAKGALAGAVSIFPCLGMSQRVNAFATPNLSNFGLILSNAYKNTLGFISPKAVLDKNSVLETNIYIDIEMPNAKKYLKQAKHLSHKTLFFTKNIANKLFMKSNCYAQSSNNFKKHVVSRIGFASAAVLYTATRAADLALGVGSAALSIAALGQSDTLNSYAFGGLTAPLVVNDWLRCAHRFIKPL